MSCLLGCWKGHRGCGSGNASQARRHRPSRAGCHCAVPSRAWHRDDALEAATSSSTLTLLAAIAGMAASAVTVLPRTGLSARNVLDL